ncbi:uncharacterized protein LOC125491127 [Plutella xylostella]|uniref:uncharacterized protein LOC125491127 n=1 Tax=Plutella xylostella TaxID=51655 RepID=UPI0020324171|nr:uncharacterized protein LOC125491127 [Plutella xylostella]
MADKDDTMAAAGQPLLHNIEATIPRFSGADPTYTAAKWVEEIGDNAEVFSWSPSQKLLMARRALTGVAALWLRSEKNFKTFDELQKALLKEFPDEVNTKDIHELMTNRKKKRDESCYEYMLIMKELGKRGKFPDYVAIQYIVDGIVDFETNKVMLYGVSTYSVLKERLQIYETMKKNSAKNNHPAATTMAKRTGAAVAARNTPTPPQRRCFQCGDVNHFASDCKNGVKCYKCNQFGHIAPHCHATSNTTSMAEHRGREVGTSGTQPRRSMCVTATTAAAAAAHDNTDGGQVGSTATVCGCFDTSDMNQM